MAENKVPYREGPTCWWSGLAEPRHKAGTAMGPKQRHSPWKSLETNKHLSGCCWRRLCHLHLRAHAQCYMETLQGVRDTLGSFCFVVNEVSYLVDQAGLELPAVLLSHPPKC